MKGLTCNFLAHHSSVAAIVPFAESLPSQVSPFFKEVHNRHFIWRSLNLFFRVSFAHFFLVAPSDLGSLVVASGCGKLVGWEAVNAIPIVPLLPKPIVTIPLSCHGCGT